MRPMICYFIIRPRVEKERNMERMKREERTDTGRKRSIDRQIDGAIRAFQIFRPSARRLSFELPAEKKGRGSLTEISPSFVKKKGEKNRSKNCQEHDTYEDVIIISISTRYKYLVCPYIYVYTLEAEFLREPILESILRMFEEHRDKQAPSRRRGNFFEVFTSSLERNESFEAKISIRRIPDG